MNQTEKLLLAAQIIETGHKPRKFRVGSPKPARYPAYRIVDESGTEVASVPIRATGEPHKDAALIAAAPDLLDALKGAINTAHANGARCAFDKPLVPINPCPCTQHAHYQDARAAIAKAEGR